MLRTTLGLLALLAGFLVAGSVPADQLVGENLLTPLPDGFELAYSEGATFMEYVPKGETVQDWSRILTVSIAEGRIFDPDDYNETLAAGWKKACPGGEGTKVTSGSENHYPFSVWLYICPLNPQTQKPETMTMKSIRGDDSFYIVQYAHRKEADASVVAPEATYLKTVIVCDTRKADRACPAGM
jgi:hypothetical protein